MNLNKVFIIGRLTHEPESRTTTTGQTVTTLKLATNRVWSDKSGQKQEATEYHTVIAWARLGEIASQYLKKGGLAMIEGRLQTRSWVDQSNNKRYVTEIIAESLQLGPRTTGASGGGYEPRPASSAGGPAMTDVERPRPSFSSTKPAGAPVQDADIPIIGEDEPTVSSGVEEDEVKISEKDLPF